MLNDENWRDHIKVEQIWSYHIRKAGYWMGTVGKVFHGYVPQPGSVYQALYDSEPFTVIHNSSTERTDWGGLYGIGFDNEEHWYDVMVSETTADFLANTAPGIAAEGRFWHWEAGFHHPHNPWYTPNRIYESIDLDDIVMPEDWPLSWDLLPFAAGVRGSGSADGDLEGLTAECEHCGGPLPEGSSANRMYCSRECKQAAYAERVHAARIAARQGRICLWCNGPIPAEARGDVIYCSKTCQTRSQIDMQKTRRTCQHCGKSFRGFGRFCSHPCYAASRRKRHPKQCPVCQVVFKPHRIEQVCCSRSCRDKRAKQHKL